MENICYILATDVVATDIQFGTDNLQAERNARRS